MDSLLNTLAGQIDDRTIQQLSSQIGADPNTTQQAVSAALPMLLGALERNTTSSQGAEALTNAVQRDHNGSILNNLSSALADPATLQDGSAILGHVLGANQSNVQSGISSFSGLDQNSTGQLLALLAPVVLGALGQMQQQHNLDANGVAGVLQNERPQTESILGGFAQLLDMDHDGDITDDIINIGSQLLSGWLGKK
ncbi:MAG TPA: DUF937 domain-containing protein [Anaerolineae bacterium]|nr:DUF937 domain-containing protein [Anaerolineae bacterium]MCB9106546.1 DUF937 domain-containing protein [Anaerolineales bacterium]HRV92860.1 DUF937 domain-containing protein [Anaerolineae bacterium]